MDDLISRQKVISTINVLRPRCDTDDIDDYHDLLVEAIEALPPSPSRPKGKWIPQNLNKSDGMISTAVYYYPKCSVCGANANYTNFCPNCGADMRGDTDESD